MLNTPETYTSDISEALALSAYEGVSMFPERRAASTRRDYANTLAADFAELARAASTPEKLAVLEAEFPRYREGFRRAYTRYLASNARCVSWFVAGPSNFPAARMQKRADVAGRRLNEVFAFRERALTAIRRTLCPELRPIMSGDADALDRITEKLDQARHLQERMKDANAAIRKHRKAGAEAQQIALVTLGFTPLQASKLLIPDFCGRIGFPDYALTNNGANIRRMEARVSSLTVAKATPDRRIQCENAELEHSPADNRVRLYFGGKPAEEIRAKLKAGGFRWSPSIGAWQAYYNFHTVHLAKTLAGAPSLADKAENPAPAAA